MRKNANVSRFYKSAAHYHTVPRVGLQMKASRRSTIIDAIEKRQSAKYKHSARPFAVISTRAGTRKKTHTRKWQANDGIPQCNGCDLICFPLRSHISRMSSGSGIFPSLDLFVVHLSVVISLPWVLTASERSAGFVCKYFIVARLSTLCFPAHSDIDSDNL